MPIYFAWMKNRRSSDMCLVWKTDRVGASVPINYFDIQYIGASP